MITNEEAVRNQLKIISSNPVKRKEKLHDKNWDNSLFDGKQLRKMTTQELAKKLVFEANQFNENGTVYTIYKWHFDNSNYLGLGKQGTIVACKYWLRKKNMKLLGNV